ncbi:19597_t:CDS:2 [Funneliformis geosporum]|uniref:2712_t:CDS:1 n=1 Tax=Funneliformis geosporum TaxID=1117311 RepID=A0A9W4SU79_9GLOM|nr:19597_t:CDS:2 [Funneliformis geosporum]CAI2181626.1 2712_t:CDS:2 [Funneliformis geosporum]
MGNVIEGFSDCIPKKKKKTQGYKLGTRNENNNNNPVENNVRSEKLEKTGKKTSGEHNNGKTVGNVGVKTGGIPSREDMAAAAQKRQDDAKLKGVIKGGGKLSKKLEEQQKNANQPDSIPSNSNLQWRID